MKFPIIEFRETNLWVLTEFGDPITGTTIRIPRNLANNRTRHIVDSHGDLWSFDFVRTDHRGIRRIISTLWNISSDYYTYVQEANISVETFRQLVEPHRRNTNPHQQEMALSLLEPLASHDASARLRNHIQLLNL